MRVIKYFAVIREPMQKGEELELLVNYCHAYETNGERRGYGKSNLAHREKGDEHLPSCLRRNFPEREHFILDVQEANMCNFAMLIKFCVGIAKPLHNILDDFMRWDPTGSGRQSRSLLFDDLSGFPPFAMPDCWKTPRNHATDLPTRWG